MLSNPIELAVHNYLSKVSNDDSILSKEIINTITEDIRTALTKQFVDKRNKKFTLRMSNMGKPYCQLWFEKNKPEKAIPPSTNFIINMLIGDIVEAVFKGLLQASGVKFENGKKVTLNLGDGYKIEGTPDITFDEDLDDIKSASPWSYDNKFKNYDTLAEKDNFGYIAQLAGYAKAANKNANGWWVINKGNGSFKHVKATGIDVKKVLHKTKELAKELDKNLFKRCFDDEPETYRKKPSGNRKLCMECSWCSFRHTCWPGLQERPSVVSKAENPPMVSYTKLNHV